MASDRHRLPVSWHSPDAEVARPGSSASDRHPMPVNWRSSRGRTSRTHSMAMHRRGVAVNRYSSPRGRSRVRSMAIDRRGVAVNRYSFAAPDPPRRLADSAARRGAVGAARCGPPRRGEKRCGPPRRRAGPHSGRRWPASAGRGRGGRSRSDSGGRAALNGRAGVAHETPDGHRGEVILGELAAQLLKQRQRVLRSGDGQLDDLAGVQLAE